MKWYMLLTGVGGVVLLIGGICMLLASIESVQIGGLVMMFCALSMIMQVRFLKIETRLRTLEGKPKD